VLGANDTIDASLNTTDRFVITGLNLGEPEPSPAATVFVGAAPCISVSHENDKRITCSLSLAGGLIVGWHNVTVTLHNQTCTRTVNVSALCSPGYYGKDGENCTSCDAIPGSVCDGFGTEPYARLGFSRVSRTEFVACLPAESCLGGPDSECATGYTGIHCSCTCACVVLSRRVRIVFVLCMPALSRWF
jgi:hypothetical protein